MSTHRLTSYINLLSSFVTGSISASDFEDQYLDMYKNDATIFPAEEFNVLDTLFGDVDAFTPDPDLRDEGDLDVEQLKQSAADALEKLKMLQVS